MKSKVLWVVSGFMLLVFTGCATVGEDNELVGELGEAELAESGMIPPSANYTPIQAPVYPPLNQPYSPNLMNENNGRVMNIDRLNVGEANLPIPQMQSQTQPNAMQNGTNATPQTQNGVVKNGNGNYEEYVSDYTQEYVPSYIAPSEVVPYEQVLPAPQDSQSNQPNAPYNTPYLANEPIPSQYGQNQYAQNGVNGLIPPAPVPNPNIANQHLANQNVPNPYAPNAPYPPNQHLENPYLTNPPYPPNMPYPVNPQINPQANPQANVAISPECYYGQHCPQQPQVPQAPQEPMKSPTMPPLAEPQAGQAQQAQPQQVGQPEPKVPNIIPNSPLLEAENVIELSAVGMGVAPENTISPSQALALAKRAAIIDAYRQIGEKMYGIKINGKDTVKDMVLSNSVVKAQVEALIKNADIVETIYKDGLCQVTMELKLDSRTWNRILATNS